MRPVEIVDEASKALASIHKTRNFERRNAPPGDVQRSERIQAAIDRINTVMIPVRSLRGRLQWESTLLSESDADRLISISHDLQYERRQLKKMLRRVSVE